LSFTEVLGGKIRDKIGFWGMKKRHGVGKEIFVSIGVVVRINGLPG
jgi:hypothetical protein